MKQTSTGGACFHINTVTCPNCDPMKRNMFPGTAGIYGENYEVIASCSNCDWSGNVSVPKGILLGSKACPRCGCCSLVKNRAGYRLGAPIMLANNQGTMSLKPHHEISDVSSPLKKEDPTPEIDFTRIAKDLMKAIETDEKAMDTAIYKVVQDDLKSFLKDMKN